MNKRTTSHTHGTTKLCFGCGEHFPVRHGQSEAQVGFDGELYCYAATPECAFLAVLPPAFKCAA